MSARCVNPRRVKLHRSYSVDELARCLDVHTNTVRNWKANGLNSIDKSHPVLFQGATVRAFLEHRRSSRKRPCPPGMLYCFRCRSPRAPALGLVDFIAMRPGGGNLRALCEYCGTIMHRRVRGSEISQVMPKCDVQFVESQPRLSGQATPSLNCDIKRSG